MAEIVKIPVTLLGFQGAPGLNTWYGLMDDEGPVELTALTAFHTAIFTFYQAIDGYLVEEMREVVPSTVDILNIETGTLLRRQGGLTPHTNPGQPNSSITARHTQAKAQFHSDTVVNGRLLRGGHFIGPINDLAMDTTGNITSEFQSALALAYGPMIAMAEGMSLALWHQASPANPSGGVADQVSSVSVNPLPAVLRSRRS